MQLIYYSNTLCHHGIKGQRWGDRNGPPYPLDSKAHSASEKKAGWKKSLDPKSVKKLERKVRELHEREDQNHEKNLLKNSQDNKNPKDHKLTDSQKKTIRNVAIGVAAAAGIGVGMYFAYKHHAINSIADAMASGNADKSVLKHTIEYYFDIKNNMAESPFIVFNPSKSLIKKGETFVTKQMKIDTLEDLMRGGTTKMTAGTEYVSDILRAIYLGFL